MKTAYDDISITADNLFRHADTVVPPRLLVSVRSAAEAISAVQGGADIIDVKEPAAGALGRAECKTIAEIHRVLRDSDHSAESLSAALGELKELPDWDLLAPILAHVRWVKVGLSGMAEDHWREEWLRLHDRIAEASPRTKLIAVAYADWRHCGAPSPTEVVETALESDSPGVLFDTFLKQGRSLLDGITPAELQMLIAELHAARKFAALAGSLSLEQLPAILDLNPEIIAVRSAVCEHGRQGHVRSELVRNFRTAMTRPNEMARH